MVINNCIKDYYLLFFNKFKWLVIWLLFSINGLGAQNLELIDSLNQGFEQELDDSVRIAYLNELAWQWKKVDGELALAYANQAMDLALSLNRPQDVATSLNRIGEIYRIQGDYRESIKQFKKALTIDQEMENQHGMARASSLLGTLYSKLGQYDSSLFFAQRGLGFFMQTQNAAAVGRSHTRIAGIYKNLDQFDLAIAHSDSALNLQIGKASENDIAQSYYSLGNLYRRMGLIDSARHHFAKSLAIRKRNNDEYEISLIFNAIGSIHDKQDSYDSAMYYFRKSMALVEKIGVKSLIGALYNNMGNVYEDIGQPDSALIYYQKSIAIKIENMDSSGLTLTYNNIGNVYKTSNDHEKALDYYNKSVQFAGSKPNLTLLNEYYYNLSQTYAQLGDMDKAMEFKDRYESIRDSLNNSVRSAAFIHSQYEIEKSRRVVAEKEQQLQKAELDQLRSENARKKMIISTISLGLLLMVLGIIFYYRSKFQKQQVVIAEKNQNIAKQQVHKLLKDQEINSMNAMIEGQEGERKRIARDLHDRLGSMLSMVKLHFKSVEDDMEDLKVQDNTQYLQANVLLDEACDEVRKIAQDLVSGVLTKFGLIPALRSLEQSVVETGQLDMKVLEFGMGEERLEYNIEIEIYRIIQELLSNVLKHARAKEMTVQLIRKNGNLNLVVEDDGVGFKMDGGNGRSGMGLKNIGSRVDKLHGEMKIDSGKGGGTTVTIDFSKLN